MQQRANLERTMILLTCLTLWHITKKAFVLLSLCDSDNASDKNAEVAVAWSCKARWSHRLHSLLFWSHRVQSMLLNVWACIKLQGMIYMYGLKAD